VKAALNAADAAWAHDPAAHGTAYRIESGASSIPEFTDMPPGIPVMPDTNVYIYRNQNKLPRHVAEFVLGRETLHCGVALAEIAISAGILDPSHPMTAIYSEPLRALLAAIPLSDCRAPSPRAWAEAGMMSGILARTQLDLAKPRAGLSNDQRCCQEGRRRLLLNDALIFLTAVENAAVLVTANAKDMNLMRRLRPDAKVLTFVV